MNKSTPSIFLPLKHYYGRIRYWKVWRDTAEKPTGHSIVFSFAPDHSSSSYNIYIIIYIQRQPHGSIEKRTKGPRNREQKLLKGDHFSLLLLKVFSQACNNMLILNAKALLWLGAMSCTSLSASNYEASSTESAKATDGFSWLCLFVFFFCTFLLCPHMAGFHRVVLLTAVAREHISMKLHVGSAV